VRRAANLFQSVPRAEGARVRDVTVTHNGVRRICGAILLAVLAITIGSTIPRPSDPGQVVAAGAVRASTPPPLDQVRRMLRRQATALLRGDRAGWLAAVDQPVRGRYADLYRTLRALRVTTLDYRVVGGRPPSVTVELSYCFSACTGERPRVAQSLTVRAAGDTYVISALAAPGRPTDFQPAPWEAGDLVFAQGGRVTVAAPRALAGRLAEVVALADRAAAVDDRYAALAGNRQARYRVFLATDELWRTWYGGRATGWAVGYMQPLASAGADVVIDPSRIRGRSALREVLQHELGHVATIGGADPEADDMWLVEGVAEYIAYAPRPATDNVRSTYLRTGKFPTTLFQTPLDDTSPARTVTRFYGYGHLAVDCLVKTYGEKAFFTFFGRVVRDQGNIQKVSLAEFHRPWREVDKACVSTIRREVR
jgi:hypothetical protein